MLNNPGLIKSFIAATLIPQHTVVAIDAADDSVKLATASSDPVLGVSSEPADTPVGKPVDITLSGVGIVKAGGVIAKGSWLTVDASGRVITTTTAAHERIGRALSAANAANDLVSIEIIKGLG